MLLGFSTGCTYKNIDVKQTLKLYRELGIKSVELGLVRWERLDGESLDIIGTDLEGFERVSLHAPAFAYDKDEATKAVINKIQTINEIHPLDCVVVHPDPVKDFTPWAESGLPVGIENMDVRKLAYQRPEEVKKLLTEFPQFGFVFDVNHIWSIHKQMEPAKEFHKMLGDRLMQYHLSGYRELHDPLFETLQTAIIDAVTDRSKPVIVESLLSPEAVTTERKYILSHA